MRLLLVGALLALVWCEQEQGDVKVDGDNDGYQPQDDYAVTPGSVLLRLHLKHNRECNATEHEHTNTLEKMEINDKFSTESCCRDPFSGIEYDFCFEGELSYLSGNLFGKRMGISSAFCEIDLTYTRHGHIRRDDFEYVKDDAYVGVGTGDDAYEDDDHFVKRFPQHPSAETKGGILHCKQYFETYWGKLAVIVDYKSCTLDCGPPPNVGLLNLKESDQIGPFITAMNNTLMPWSGSMFDALRGKTIIKGTGIGGDLSGLNFHLLFNSMDSIYYGMKFDFKNEEHYKCNGNCGYQNDNYCWCDDKCIYHGDCCVDVCDTCMQSCHLDDLPDHFIERSQATRGIHYSVYGAVAGGSTLLGLGVILACKRKRRREIGMV